MPSLLIILPVKQTYEAVAGGGEKQEAREDFREGQAKPYSILLVFNLAPIKLAEGFKPLPTTKSLR